MAKFSASDEESDTKRHKKRSKFKECEDNGKKHRKKNSSICCSLRGENKSHTSRECKLIKKRDKDKDNTTHGKEDYMKNFKEINLLKAQADHQKSKNKKLNKAFSKKKTSKEENVILDDTLDSNYSSISEDENSTYEGEKTSIPYNSDPSEDYKSSSSSIGIKGNI